MFNLSHSEFVLRGFCDADWGSCISIAKSLSGYAIFLGDSLISWKTKKQKTTSKSTCEAEYRSMSYATSELIWLHGLMTDLQINVPLPIGLSCDNTATQYIAENQIFQERTKHLRVDCHFIRDYIDNNFLQLSHVSSAMQLADILTKALSAPQTRFLCSKLRLVLHHPSLA